MHDTILLLKLFIMSVKLLQTDYMSVIGEFKEGSYITASSDEELKNISHTTYFIDLFFTIQINGKLKTFNHTFELDKMPNDVAEDFVIPFTLKNRECWYILFNTLDDLGYSISEQGNIITSWIEKLEIPKSSINLPVEREFSIPEVPKV